VKIKNWVEALSLIFFASTSQCIKSWKGRELASQDVSSSFLSFISSEMMHRIIVVLYHAILSSISSCEFHVHPVFVVVAGNE